MMARDYAVYKGDELLVIGTKKECAEFLGVGEVVIKNWATPKYVAEHGGKNHKVAIRLEEDA